jgi:hypothetical protein
VPDEPLEESRIELRFFSLVQRSLAFAILEINVSNSWNLAAVNFFQHQQARKGVTPVTTSIREPARINRSRVTMSSHQPAAKSPRPGAARGAFNQ